MGMWRRRRQQPEDLPEGVEPERLEPVWRSAVEETIASRRRLRALVEECRSGPLQERLASLAERVDSGVLAAWKIASRAQAASRALVSMDLESVHADLKDARRRAADGAKGGADVGQVEREVKVLAEQHAALNQLRNAIDDASSRLRLLDLRLDTAVARAAQIVLQPDALEELGSVDQELADVVEELDLLRAGLDAARSSGA